MLPSKVKVEVVQAGVHQSGKPVPVGSVIEVTENHYRCCSSRFAIVDEEEPKPKPKRKAGK